MLDSWPSVASQALDGCGALQPFGLQTLSLEWAPLLLPRPSGQGQLYAVAVGLQVLWCHNANRGASGACSRRPGCEHDL